MREARFCLRCGSLLATKSIDRRERGACNDCGWIWWSHPTPVVLVLAVAPSGRIVYTRDDRFPQGGWGLVAGFIEQGEPAEVAALCEVEEESGLPARSPRLLRTMTYRENFLVAVRVRVDDGIVIPESGTEVVLDAPDLTRVVPDTPAYELVAAHIARGLRS